MPSMDGIDAMPAADAAGRPDASAAPAKAVAVDTPGKNHERGTRPMRRAPRHRHRAVAAAGEVDEDQRLGALNRELKLIMEQLGTAHRVIGRVAAERDALRQQLADLQGIPVEEIVITPITASKED
jgi:hypothetical protein